MVKRVGLVLGSGGATGGAFHAGVLKALDDAGFDGRTAEIIIGTSAGSIAGATLRAGMPPQDMFNRSTGQRLSAEGLAVRNRIPALERDDPELGLRTRGPQAPDLLKAFRPGRMKVGVAAAAALPEGKVSTSAISAGVNGICGNAWPQQPLWVVATALTDGNRVVYGRDARGPIGECVAASCAIPGYFRPVVINGIKHVDGGMYSACNLDLLAGQGLDTVIVSSPMSIHTAFGKTLDLPFRQFLRRQLNQEAKLLRNQGTEVIILAPTAEDLPVMGVNPMAPGREEPVARQVLASMAKRIREESLLAGLTAS